MPGRPVTDEEVLDWWEAYDAGLSIEQVAKLYQRDRSTVHRHLHALGVTRSRGGEPLPDDEVVLDLAGTFRKSIRADLRRAGLLS